MNKAAGIAYVSILHKDLHAVTCVIEYASGAHH